jgi:hypothetical protein
MFHQNQILQAKNSLEIKFPTRVPTAPPACPHAARRRFPRPNPIKRDPNLLITPANCVHTPTKIDSVPESVKTPVKNTHKTCHLAEFLSKKQLIQNSR